MLSVIRSSALAALLLATAPVHADEIYQLTIKDHRFNPVSVTVPAGKKVKLTIKNLETTPEEFESYELNREKIIPGGSEVSVYIGPLKPGEYPFFGEFHMDTAKGVIVAK